MKILGLSAFYHESAACLLVDGELIAAAAQERFSRVKHDPRLPVEAVRCCLDVAGLDVADLDAVALYEEPEVKLARQLWAGARRGDRQLAWCDPDRPRDAIRRLLGWDGPLLAFPHHLSHAASAYYFSGFEDAAVLTVDGVGEWATTTYGRGLGGELELFEQVDFPHSLGLFYSTLTSYLGFRVNGGEYKVMGLAPYGRPRLRAAMRRLLRSTADGGFELDPRYFDFIRGERMYSPRMEQLLGGPPRVAEGPLTQFHFDLARSAQERLEEVLLEKVAYLARRVPSRHLCLAGGVALNCVANGRIRREGPFADLFVQPAAGDAGGCLGAAALAHRQLTGRPPARRRLADARLGPSWSADEVAELLAAAELPAADYRGRGDELIEQVAERLVAGQVIGWFSGRMEFGPRALGGRSILASPLLDGMRDRVNRRVKKREGFRPFAPCVLAEEAARHFALDAASPFMLETCAVTSPLALPAITHVDGSARPQTVDRRLQPRLAALLDAFARRTGCPVLLNTSLNVRGEPIAATPADALGCLVAARLDALVLEQSLLDRRDLPADLETLMALWPRPRPSPFAAGRSTVSEVLYTFV